MSIKRHCIVFHVVVFVVVVGVLVGSAGRVFVLSERPFDRATFTMCGTLIHIQERIGGQ